MKVRTAMAISIVSAVYVGVGLTVQQLGMAAGLGLFWTMFILATAVVQWLIIAFTVLPQVMEAIKQKDNEKEKDPSAADS